MSAVTRSLGPSHTGPTDAHGRPMRDVRISVTDRCNFRCPYCMPAEVFGEEYRFLRKQHMLTVRELVRVAHLFVAEGAGKIRLTGGEPLLWRELPDLIAQLAGIEGLEDLTLTTNGLLLAEQAHALAAAGLQRITVSLDSTDPAVFRRMAGRDYDPATVLAGIAAAERAGLNPIKINCVVRRGVNDHTVVDLARHFHGTRHILRFIEYMDVGTMNGWVRDEIVEAREIVDRIDAALPLEPVAPNYRGEVATRYRYRDGGGEIGMITSVSEPFCGDCTRARLSADGVLLTCLFASGGRDLRGPLRGGASDAELRSIIREVWTARSDRYSEERSELLAAAGAPTTRLQMYQIGG